MSRPPFLPRALRQAAALALAAGAATAAVTVFLPNDYKAEARILPDAGTAPPSSWRTGLWAPTAPPQNLGSREDGPTVIFEEILKSRRMASCLLEAEYEYPLRPWRFGKPRPVRSTLLQYLDAPDLDRAMGAFRRLLTVERSPKSGLLVIGAETRSPELSMQVARKAVATLRQVLLELSQADGRAKAKATGDRLAEVREQYDHKCAIFQRFQDADRNWEASPSPTLRFQGHQLKEDLALWRQILGNLTLNHEQALLEARNDAQALLVLDPGGLPTEKSRPHRAFLVFGAALVTGASSWALLNRSSFHDLFISREKK